MPNHAPVPTSELEATCPVPEAWKVIASHHVDVGVAHMTHNVCFVVGAGAGTRWRAPSVVSAVACVQLMHADDGAGVSCGWIRQDKDRTSLASRFFSLSFDFCFCWQELLANARDILRDSEERIEEPDRLLDEDIGSLSSLGARILSSYPLQPAATFQESTSVPRRLSCASRISGHAFCKSLGVSLLECYLQEPMLPQPRSGRDFAYVTVLWGDEYVDNAIVWATGLAASGSTFRRVCIVARGRITRSKIRILSRPGCDFALEIWRFWISWISFANASCEVLLRH